MRSSLTLVASEIKTIQDEHFMVMEMDAGFDGGEFSGPAHWRMMRLEIEQALAGHGWGAQEFEDALIERTTAKWAHDSLLCEFLPLPDRPRFEA